MVTPAVPEDLPDRTPADAHTARVREMFDAVAGRYDLANHLLSLGLHLRWKRAAVRAARLRPGDTFLDACCGTGDLLAAAADAGARVVAVDVAPRMLERAARRLGDAPAALVRADICRLPLADGSVDATAIAFGLRNVADPPRALAECHRVLRPSGRLVVLEFGRPAGALLRRLYDLYSRVVLVPVGGRLTGRPDAYRYLRDSIRRWPDPDALAGMIRRCGFDDVAYRALSGGIAVLHTARRPAVPGGGGARPPA